MRRTGVVEEPRGLGPHDHVCWPFDDEGEFQAAALSFLEDGLRLGQRVSYAGEGTVDELREQLDPLGVLDDLIAAGTLELISLSDRYRAGQEDGPQAQADTYAAAAHAAVNDGYTGLRVAADATSLVVDPAEWSRFVEYEHRVDRVMAAGVGLSAMCGYDRHRIDGEAVAVLACMHPLSRTGDAPFHLHATPTGIALSGEVDGLHGGRFRLLLEKALVTCDRSPISIDCRDLVFADHHVLQILDDCADEAATDLLLLEAPDVVRRLVGLLDVRRLRLA